MHTTRTITTADQLAEAGDIGRCELIRGELHMMTPASSGHGRVTMNLAGMIWQHARDRDLGTVYTADPGYIVERDPDTVRAPDIAFIRKSREHLVPEMGFAPLAPDLAVEVVSPNDTASEVAEKTQMWLNAGVRQVWVVDPENRQVAVHLPDGTARTLRESDTLTGGDVLAGLAIPVASIFAR